MMNLVDEISQHFNRPDRVKHDLDNYDLELVGCVNISRDPFEIPRQTSILKKAISICQKNASILDIGCGVGSLVLNFLKLGYEAHGVDISIAMVEAAKSILKNNGFDEQNIQYADVLNFNANHLYDLIILNGVIWYYENKENILNKVHSLLKPNGNALIVHRNDLFNIFALNNGMVDFLFKNILAHLNDGEQKCLHDKLCSELPGIMQPVKNNSTLKKPYDNPFTIYELYSKSRLKIKEIFYTYIHPLPPRFEIKFPDEVYNELQEKYGEQWQGMLMGSQFVVVAEKI